MVLIDFGLFLKSDVLSSFDYISCGILSLVIVTSYKLKNKQILNEDGSRFTYWIEYSLLLLMKTCLLPRMSFTLYFLIKMLRSLLLYWSHKIAYQLELVRRKNRKIVLKYDRSRNNSVESWRPKSDIIFVQDASMSLFLKQHLWIMVMISAACFIINRILKSDISEYLIDTVLFVLWVYNSHVLLADKQNTTFAPTSGTNNRSLNPVKLSKYKEPNFSKAFLGMSIDDVTTFLLICLSYTSLVAIYYCISPFSCIYQFWALVFVYLLFK